jgi:hypothetical protein
MSISTLRLYQISNEYERAIDTLLESEEKDESKIEELKDIFDQKCINVAKYIKNLEAEYEAIKNAIDGMQTRAKKIGTSAETLTAYLKFNMEKTGLLDPIKCPEFAISLRNNPPSLVIDNDSLIPDMYVVTKEVKSFDKNAIKKDILDGFDVEGARVENKKSLVIK